MAERSSVAAECEQIRNSILIFRVHLSCGFNRGANGRIDVHARERAARMRTIVQLHARLLEAESRLSKYAARHAR